MNNTLLYAVNNKQLTNSHLSRTIILNVWQIVSDVKERGIRFKNLPHSASQLSNISGKQQRMTVHCV